ncbi:RNA polymerase subunit sigma-70 [Rhodococcus sp. NPDC058521]|uniref:RNA polymerase subunit sigma-70 n=1 Tax=Rhodococcus sp. NPDC058521 TaxID=3346536 RepID=UPI00365A275F
MSEELSVDDLEALRGPLTGYCYRILGAAADTDDAVQETMIRAFGKLGQFDPERARLTTWVHRIATNVCFDMLRGAGRRALVIDMSPYSSGPDLGVPLPPDRWVEPMPDSRLLLAADPSDIAVERETIRLAFVAALQRLAPRQRAVLVLRDVVGFTAQETADTLETTVAAVTSALQRARATLEADRPTAADVLDPADPEQQRLLRRYVAAFESHDMAQLSELLREDAITSMPPFVWYLRGREDIVAVMGAGDACVSDRLIATSINGSPGFGQYRPDEDGVLRPFALLMLELREGLVSHSVTFLGAADRFPEFGLPERL